MPDLVAIIAGAIGVIRSKGDDFAAWGVLVLGVALAFLR